MDDAEERAQIRRAVDSLLRTTGTRPLGCYCRTGPGVNTRRLVVEEGSFLYDSDAYNDELPFWDMTQSRPHRVVPYTNDVNDSKFANPAGFGSSADVFTYLKDSFDQFYEEGGTAPGMMSAGLHLRIDGDPGRARALARLPDHLQSYRDVWLCRRIDIVRHWIATHPPHAAG